MNELPYDIVFQIVQELKLLHDPPDMEHIPSHRMRSILRPMKFTSYATLNRVWNVATERESFQNLAVYSDDIPEHLRGPITTTRFKQIMSRDPARRRAIPRDIVFFASVQSPLNSEEASTEEGRNANDRRFSASVRQFWEVLKEWPSVPAHRSLTLELRHIVITPKKPVETTDDDGDDGQDGQAVEKRRRDEMYLNLPGGPLPRLHCISHFALSNLIMYSGQTRLWPPALLNVLNSFHELRNAFLNIQDIQVTERSLWTDYREGADQQSLTPAFARMNMLMPLVNLILELSSIFAVLPNTISNFAANFSSTSRGYSNLPSYASLAYDPLSISLRDMSTRLVCLILMDIRITPALFWPCANEPASTPLPFWPHLQRLELWFAPLDPCGNWYAEPPGEVAEVVINNVFQRPREEHINPLLAAIGHAVRCMPQLKSMDIQMEARHEDVEMLEDFDDAELSLTVTRLYTARGVQDSDLTLCWKAMPPVPWAAETISVWGMEENAELLKLGEADAPMVELQAKLLL